MNTPIFSWLNHHFPRGFLPNRASQSVGFQWFRFPFPKPSRSTDTDKSGYLSENEIKGGGGGTWRSFVSLPEGLENPWTTEWPLMPTFDSMMAIKKYSWVIISKRIEAVTMCFGSRNWNLRRWAKHVCIDLESRWRWDWGKSPTGFIQNEAFFRPKMVILLRRMMVNYHWWGTIEFWGTRTQNPCPKLSEFTQSARSFASCRFEHGPESWSVLKLAPWTCFGTMKCTVAQGKQSQLTWLLEVIFCIGNHYNYLKINHYNF